MIQTKKLKQQLKEANLLKGHIAKCVQYIDTALFLDRQDDAYQALSILKGIIRNETTPTKVTKL